MCVAFVSSFFTAGVVESKYLQKKYEKLLTTVPATRAEEVFGPAPSLQLIHPEAAIIYGKPLSTSWGI